MMSPAEIPSGLLIFFRDEQIRNLVEKLSNLEKVVSHKVLPPETAVQGSTTQSPSTDIDTSSRPIKRRRDARNITTQDLLSPPDSVASQQRPNECCNFIQKELSYNSKLAECQRSILEIAVSFIEQLSQAPSSAPADHAWGLQVSTDFTPGELIQIVLASTFPECSPKNAEDSRSTRTKRVFPATAAHA